MREKKKSNAKELKTRPILDLTRTVSRDIFTSPQMPWDAIPNISAYINKNGCRLPYDEYDEISENVWVHVSAYLSPSAKIEAPAIICGGARLCHHTHVQGSVIGAFATVGELSTVKGSIMFDRSKLCGHNALYSSILGYQSVMAAGSVCADTRLDGTNVTVEMPEGIYLTDKGKLGAVICDGAKVGALCVINPGTVVDCFSTVYPLTSVSGYVYPYSSVK